MSRKFKTYAELLEHGKALLDKYSGGVWTDHYEHDPGITTLEFLCYALTDLDLRVGLPLEDILEAHLPEKDENESDVLYGKCRPLEILHKDLESDRTLPIPEKILPGVAVTERDYQKQLLDIEGVQSVWRTTLESDRSVTWFIACNASLDKTGRQSVVQRAAKLLMRFRGLGEKVPAVRLVTGLPIDITCRVSIPPEADTVEYEARCRLSLENFFRPSAQFYSLYSLLEKEVPIERIYEGPLLNHGFLLEEDLPDLDPVTTINRPQLCRICKEGIQSNADSRVTLSVVLRRNGEDVPVDEISLGNDDNESVLELGKVEFIFSVQGGVCKNGHTGAEAVAHRMQHIREEDRALRGLRADVELEFPVGDGHEIIDYTTIQNHFPQIYGLGPDGVPDNSDLESVASAKQFAGFLLLFDQIMADHLAQLAHSRDLFSLHTQRSSYFSHPPQDCVLFDELMTPDATSRFRHSAESSHVFSDRRERFLKHLLAYFAERGACAYSCPQQESCPERSAGRQEAMQQLLANYVRISSRRGVGTLPGEGGSSGLELRMEYDLALCNEASPPLYGDLFIRTSEKNEFTEQEEFRCYLCEGDQVLIGGSPVYSSQEEMQEGMRRILKYGSYYCFYEIDCIVTERGTLIYSLSLKDVAGKLLAEHTKRFTSYEEAEKERDRVQQYLAQFSMSPLLYVVEHSLLDDKGQLSIDGTDGSSKYNAHCITVLIVETDDVQKEAVEQLVVKHTPAHVLPHIFWLNDERHSEFVAIYAQWMSASPENRYSGRLVRFIDSLPDTDSSNTEVNFRVE